jgi:hypothetical protein
MSISSSELIFYSSANIPTDDTTTSGGAISTTSRPELTQFSGAAIVQIVSDGADTRAVTVTGRTISVKEGAGGTVRATISVNETTRHIAFQNSASDPSTTKARSEKVFGKNTNGTLTLTAATVTLTADPTGNITIALAASVDDSGSVANRLASTGLTFSDDSVALTVPGGGNIPAGSAIGVWVLQSLAAAAAATKSTFTLKLQGTTI